MYFSLWLLLYQKNMKVASIEKDNKRIIWLDFVKFIAISMMIAVHCTDNVTPTERSEAWYNLWGSFYGSFMRPAIPLFVNGYRSIASACKREYFYILYQTSAQDSLFLLSSGQFFIIYFPGLPDCWDFLLQSLMTSLPGQNQISLFLERYIIY